VLPDGQAKDMVCRGQRKPKSSRVMGDDLQMRIIKNNKKKTSFSTRAQDSFAFGFKNVGRDFFLPAAMK
jgi:hypothetical protein